ncbi:unnamed protein product [Nyctereutes procyonoides]|uniref:(raccoon dog) hypothetical protein n=1 Tax=Nyctereutes procyonoides TaxID=34880 RepID=A0A811ZJD5_NYCPR|nr:unnamed protein product [Nyctereutes procyonoides]
MCHHYVVGPQHHEARGPRRREACRMPPVPTTPTSWGARGPGPPPADTSDAGGQAGAGRAEQLCTAATCATARAEGARSQARGERPAAGGGRRRGRRGTDPAGERASKELSRAGGRAPVRREHVQSAQHPYYGPDSDSGLTLRHFCHFEVFVEDE